MRNGVGSLLLLVFSSAALAQVPAFFDPPALEARRKLEATRVSEPPDIDGDLGDAAWKKATPTSDFVQNEPKQGEKATHRSTVRMVFDDKALYVSAELEQPGGWTAFNQRDMRRDFPNNECDNFSVILDTLGDGRNAFSFSVNPFGAQREEQVVDDSLFEPNWDTVWRASTKRDEHGWTVEIAIPWKSLRHGGPGTVWGMQFFRRERGMNEDTVWSPIPRTVSPWRMHYAGVIKGLEPADGSLLSLQLRPYLIGRLETRRRRAASTVAPSGGGEVTWNPHGLHGGRSDRQHRLRRDRRGSPGGEPVALLGVLPRAPAVLPRVCGRVRRRHAGLRAALLQPQHRAARRRIRCPSASARAGCTAPSSAAPARWWCTPCPPPTPARRSSRWRATATTWASRAGWARWW